MTIQRLVLETIRCALDGTNLSAEACATVTPKVLEEIFKITKLHDLAHLAAESLDRNELIQKNSDIGKLFFKQRRMAVYRYEQLNYEYARICALLEQAKIPYIPLKGSVIRSLYPEPWMRTSCDIDIFVRKEDLDRATACFLSELNYKNEGTGTHDVQLYSETGVHLELHYDLIEECRYAEIAQVLSTVWDNVALVANSKYCYHMSDELFYFYHIAHMTKHFEMGGCGIRSFIDLWLLEQDALDKREKRDALLEKAKLLTFANAARRLAEVWFSGAESDSLTEEMQQYVFSGGVYGTIDNQIAVERKKGTGKFKYILSCIFLKYDDMKITYPVLQKHKWLFPFYQVGRWLRILFRGVSKSTKEKLKVNASMPKEKEEQVSLLLQKLGL
ncbi:MAG: nucleotidyltransferase family protein [Clostridia bacterium]|nr:nucleotidyltransferase family protein [Clostridia bacterium]